MNLHPTPLSGEASAYQGGAFSISIRRAAKYVHYEQVEDVLERMQDQCVRELWQLEELEPEDWQTLRVPVGLSAAIRREARKAAPRAEKPSRWASVRKKLAEGRQEEVPDIQFDLGGFIPRFRMEMALLCRIGSVFDYVLPRDHQEAFKRCVIHNKTGHELKSHIMMLSEVWMITFSVLLGACVGMWGLMPVDVLTSVGVAVTFEVLMGLTLFLLLVCIMIHAVILLNFSSVHEGNANAFALLCMNTLQLGELLVLVNALLFTGVLLFITIARVHAVTKDPWIPAVCLCFSFGILYLMAIHSINFISCLSMHGAMLPPNEVSDLDPVEVTRVQERELVSPLLRSASRNHFADIVAMAAPNVAEAHTGSLPHAGFIRRHQDRS